MLDQSGAAIPDADVEAIHGATQVTLRTKTTGAGQFLFPAAQSGVYSVRVTAPGFSAAVIEDVAVTLNQRSSLTVNLKVGTIAETVEISASVARLETSTAQQSMSIANQTYTSLPLALNGQARSPVAFLFLAPGVNAAKDPTPGNQNSQTSVNGGQTMSMDVHVDGAPIQNTNTAGDLSNIPVPVDAVEEFTLVSSNFSAEFGRTSGGVVSLVTKSGTNRFRGAAYDFLRNNVLDARGFFLNTAAVNRQNEFGGNLGGPVKLPGYNGKDRTFFFGYYSGFRNRTGPGNFQATLPTALMKQGDFSELRDSRGNVIPVHDPATNRLDSRGVTVRDQFPGNVIPRNRWDPISANLVSLIPDPTFDRQVNNYIAQTRPASNGSDGFGAKLDHVISEKSRLSGVLTFFEIYSRNASTFDPPLAARQNSTRYQKLARINHDYMLSPTVMNHLGLGFNRNRRLLHYTSPDETNLGEVLGIPFTGRNLGPSINIATYVNLGGGTNDFKQAETGYTINDFVAITRGKHSFKIGGEYRANGDNQNTEDAVSFSFSQQQTSNVNMPNQSSTGDAFASFLLGTANGSNIRQTYVTTANRFRYFSAFIQDDFRATRKLTLNLGFRYDIPWTRVDANDNIASFDPSVPNPAAGGRLGAATFAGNGPGRIGRRNFADTYYKMFQPRFGFAYQLGDTTVLRGGYGVFSSTNGDVIENGIRNEYSQGFNYFNNLNNVDNGVTGVLRLQDGFPQNFPKPPFIDPTLNVGGQLHWLAREDGRPGIIQNWSFTIQQQIFGSTVVEAAYVANKGNRLASRTINVNQVDPRFLSLGSALNAQITSAAGQATGVPLPYPGFTGTVAQALRPYPQYTNVPRNQQTAGNSTYHSMQISVRRRFSQGLSLQAAYTMSKALTDAEASSGVFNTAGMDNYNRQLEKALSRYDLPHNLSLAYVYELPFGRGRALLNRGGFLGALVGGWATSGALRYASGQPLGVSMNNTLPIFNSALRPNVASNVPILTDIDRGAFDPAKDVYLNLAAFPAPAPFTFGNAPRLLPNVRSFPFFNEDLALSKRTNITEAANSEVRFECFNALNRVVFSNPATNISNTAAFGRVSGQANRPRVCQAGLHLRF